ncbi:MAG: hypothetical protein ACM3JG_01490 [Thiohalocapsa sp.]
MRSLFVTGVAAALLVGGAAAQAQNPPAKDGPQNSAINSSSSSNRHVAAPVQGHNSFTEGEAKSRIEKKGFTNVSKLTKDDTGVWRGQAVMNGKPVAVSLDYQGNVIAGSGSTRMPVTGSAGK